MKKQVLFMCLCLFGGIGPVSAQLKVNADGCIAMRTTQTPLSPVAINCQGNVNYEVAVHGNVNGIFCYAKGDSTTSTTYGNCIVSKLSEQHNSIGIYTLAGTESASTTPTNYYCHGIKAIAGGGKKNIGVLGRIRATCEGAAVFGSTYFGNDVTPPNDHHSYAGYFNGDTKITGNLNVIGSIDGVLLGASVPNGSDSNLSEEQKSDKGVNVSDKMSKVTIGTYDYFQNEDFCSMCDFYPDNIIRDQVYKKTHYALSAEDLEEVFPDLVYEKEDGSKVINYIEMIPLLLQSINELNARLNKNEGGKETVHKSPLSIEKKKITRASHLFQNTPNPFSERTEIRFTLAENAQSAYICIFDMTGKMLKQIPVDSSMQSVTVNGYELSAGIYLYSLVVNGQEIDTKRMILSK